MNTNKPKSRSLLSFVLLLFALSIPLWILGSIFDVQIFPGFNLYQLPLAMPMVTALVLSYRERGIKGVKELLKRTYDFRNIKSKIWYLPMLLIYPSFGFINYWVLRLSGTSISSPDGLCPRSDAGALERAEVRHTPWSDMGRLSYSNFHH